MTPKQKDLNHKSQHEQWLARRAKITPEAKAAMIAKAIDILERPTGNEPEENDLLPEGYAPLRRKKQA